MSHIQQQIYTTTAVLLIGTGVYKLAHNNRPISYNQITPAMDNRHNMHHVNDYCVQDKDSIFANDQPLNPQARPWTPAPDNNTAVKNTAVKPYVPISPPKSPAQQPIQACAALLPIEEEKKLEDYYEYEWIAQRLYAADSVLKLRYIIFIAPHITKNAVRKNATLEYFATDVDLFYHLRWQCRMQVIDDKYKLFKSSIDSEELVIFHSDLHSSQNNTNVLYLVGTQNDAGKTHSVKWKMIEFMTANEIYSRYHINAMDLPPSSQSALHDQVKHDKIKYMNDIKSYEVNVNKIIRVEQIKRKPSTQPLNITFAELYQAITHAIHHNELIPIIWFDKKEQNSRYKTQMLLPVELRGGNWIGIVFDYNNHHQLVAVTICIDHIDIRRKLALFRPLSGGDEYKWFTNNITEIKATNDETRRIIWEQNEEIAYLRRLVCEQKKEIERLKGNKD